MSVVDVLRCQFFCFVTTISIYRCVSWLINFQQKYRQFFFSLTSFYSFFLRGLKLNKNFVSHLYGIEKNKILKSETRRKETKKSNGLLFIVIIMWLPKRLRNETQTIKIWIALENRERIIILAANRPSCFVSTTQPRQRR